jgi:hypothetical protein
MRVLPAALAFAILPLSVQAQGGSGGATPAQSPPRPFSELVGEGYEVKGFAVFSRGSFEAAVMLQKQASVYLCDMKKGSSRSYRETAAAVAGSSCYLVGGAQIR